MVVFAVCAAVLPIRCNATKRLQHSQIRLASKIYSGISADELRRQCTSEPAMLAEWDSHFGHPIEIAIAEKRSDLVDVFLDLGVDPNALAKQNDWRGDTLLSLAVLSNNPDAITVLLAHGADPDLPGLDGETARAHSDTSQNADVRRLIQSHR